MIDTALAQDGFVLYFQPVVNLQGEEGEFYEVLLRIRGPTEEVLPAHFLPIAERNDRLLAIDRWVIEHAIAALGKRGSKAASTTLFIKLSTLTLHDEKLADWVDARLAAANVKASQLVFEVPEAKVMTCLKPAREFVDRWRTSGGGFGLEQFGSGLNSFQALKHIDADYLKLDRALTVDLAHHSENELKVRELCSQAHAAGKRTMVEWIEEAASMPTLFSAGVNFAQGNFLAEPSAEMRCRAFGRNAFAELTRDLEPGPMEKARLRAWTIAQMSIKLTPWPPHRAPFPPCHDWRSSPPRRTRRAPPAMSFRIATARDHPTTPT